MKKYILLIIKVLIFAILISSARNIESVWYLIPYIIVCFWFAWIITGHKDIKEKL